MPHVPSQTPLSGIFALLENTRTPGQAARYYHSPVAEIVARQPNEVALAIKALEQTGPLHACGYLTYECGYVLQGLNALNASSTVTNPTTSAADDLPLLHFYLFEECTLLNEPEVNALLTNLAAADSTPAAIFNAALGEDVTTYAAKIARIHSLIQAGETYQVNYTLPYRFDYSGSANGLYQALRAEQKVEFAGLLQFPEASVLSLSPELFVRRTGNTLITRPMKGTAPRGVSAEADTALAQALASDAKSQAENLMIVDLLRNDLGRLARTGSVKVPQLFEIETYETLHQMTSTISGELPAETGLAAILGSLFPCGSITGAPKHHTMRLIAELEDAPRGIYCGAIGYIEPAIEPAIKTILGNNGEPKNDKPENNPVNKQADFCFNVPIRTVVSASPGKAVMGTGGGIVNDSIAAAEYAEVKLKTRFLHRINRHFDLIESMRFEAGEIAHLNLHLRRLAEAASTFGFPYDAQAIISQLQAYQAVTLNNTTAPYRLRLTLNHAGEVQLSHFPVAEIPAEAKVIISAERIDSQSIFRHHKTTYREMYEAEYALAVSLGAYEALFLNEHGRVAEAARHNVFIKRGDTLITPPVSEGALPGILRQLLIEASMENSIESSIKSSIESPTQNSTQNSKQAILEAPLTLDDLRTADAIFLGNAVRGLIQVQLQP